MTSMSLPLSDHEAKDWLRTVGISEAHIRLINTTIKYREDRLQSLAIQIDSILNPVEDQVEGALADLCELPFGRKGKVQNGPAQLKLLRTSQETTDNSVHVLRSLLAPIRRLPVEILSQIFKFCLPPQKFIRPDPGKAPLFLTQICGAWRNVCISDAVLWTSLEVMNANPDTMEIDPDNRRDITPLINMWFSRAGSCRLSFSVQDDNLLNKNVADTLKRLGHRWQHLKLHIPENTCVCLPSDNKYPVLETFEICTPKGLEVDLVEDLSGAMMNATNLQQFIWLNGECHPSPIELPWDNLTHLTLKTSINIDQCLTIMSMLSKVTHLIFQDITMSTTMLSRLDITLPELTSFVICAESNIVPVFEGVTLPKLKKLVLDLQTWPHTSIADCLRRSRCPLESLNLYVPRLLDSELAECLGIVQNTLKEFTVQGNSESRVAVTDVLLDQLTYGGVGDVLCPNLAVIALYDCISCSHGHFANMVRSRLPPPPCQDPQFSSCHGASSEAPLPGVAPLKVIEMYVDEVERQGLKPLRSLGLILKMYRSDGSAIAMEPEEAERLRRFRKEGLKLHVYSSATGYFGEAD